MKADLVVIGAGAAGLTAAAVAASNALNVLVIEESAAGGQVSTVEHIRNFPGWVDGVSGYDLGALMQQQAEAQGANFLQARVDRIERRGAGFVLLCGGTEVSARAVIAACGSRRRPLGAPGEEEFAGRGVSHCASCDGPLFRAQAVVVAGGGDSAFDEAEALAAHAREVLIVHRGAAPVARRAATLRVEALQNVRSMPNAEIVRIEGDEAVRRVVLLSASGESVHACDGVFVYVGLEPNSAFLADIIERDERGAIVTDATLQSSTPGLFAAGDVRSGAVALLAAAAGEGASAAMAAAAFLREG